MSSVYVYYALLLWLQDYDLCVPCFNKDGHEHKMEKLGLDLVGGDSNDSKLSPEETRKRSLQR